MRRSLIALICVAWAFGTAHAVEIPAPVQELRATAVEVCTRTIFHGTFLNGSTTVSSFEEKGCGQGFQISANEILTVNHNFTDGIELAHAVYDRKAQGFAKHGFEIGLTTVKLSGFTVEQYVVTVEGEIFFGNVDHYAIPEMTISTPPLLSLKEAILAATPVVNSTEKGKTFVVVKRDAEVDLRLLRLSESVERSSYVRIGSSDTLRAGEDVWSIIAYKYLHNQSRDTLVFSGTKLYEYTGYIPLHLKDEENLPQQLRGMLDGMGEVPITNKMLELAMYTRKGHSGSMNVSPDGEIVGITQGGHPLQLMWVFELPLPTMPRRYVIPTSVIYEFLSG